MTKIFLKVVFAELNKHFGCSKIMHGFIWWLSYKFIDMSKLKEEPNLKSDCMMCKPQKTNRDKVSLNLVSAPAHCISLA